MRARVICLGLNHNSIACAHNSIVSRVVVLSTHNQIIFCFETHTIQLFRDVFYAFEREKLIRHHLKFKQGAAEIFED